MTSVWAARPWPWPIPLRHLLFQYWGEIEGQGPLADLFDEISNDSFFGEKTWEKAESAMRRQSFSERWRRRS